MPLVVLGFQLQRGYVSPGNPAHFSIDVVVFLVGNPVGHAVLDAPRDHASGVELGEKVPGIISTLKVGCIEAVNIVVSDEGAMVDEVLIKHLSEFILLEAASQEHLPVPQDFTFLGCRYKPGVMELPWPS